VEGWGKGTLLREQDAEYSREFDAGDPEAYKPYLSLLCGRELMARPNTDSPLMIVTATRLRGSGSRSWRDDGTAIPGWALCVSILHSLVDGSSFSLFLHSWARATCGGAAVVEKLLPVTDRCGLRSDAIRELVPHMGPQSCPKYEILGKLRAVGVYGRLFLLQRRLETCTICFSDHELRQMKRAAMGELRARGESQSVITGCSPGSW
jgi:hypothetical protein